MSEAARSCLAGAAGEPVLRLEALSKNFIRGNGQRVKAIDDVSLDLGAGDFVVLLGPSGCGKTTLLRAVAGLESPDSGTITLNGTRLFESARGLDLPPERRRIGMVFQGYALWPHMTVAQNIGYPLRMRGVSRADRDRRVAGIMAKMRIADLAGQHPGGISGGQQQRVALARALVAGDHLILFDEPLSNVDAKVREHLRLEILNMQREFDFTALYVTHDQEEAMAMATRIAVVGDGKIRQFGSAEQIYARPASLEVARFIGTANEIAARIVGPGILDTAFGKVNVADAFAGMQAGEGVTLLSRPEHWHFATTPDEAFVRGRVIATSFLGAIAQHVVRIGDGVEATADIVLRGPPQVLRPPGTEVALRLDPEGPVVFRGDA